MRKSRRIKTVEKEEKNRRRKREEGN
jgi:hypothetical protein